MRGLGLSAAQLVHVPGAGDFQVERIEAAPEPRALGEAVERPRACPAGTPEAMDAAGPGSGSGSGSGSGAGTVLAAAEPAAREALVRENAPDPLAGEQTWPTEEVRPSRCARPPVACCCLPVCFQCIVSPYEC